MSAPDFAVDVAIVGAGAAGLSAALGARAAGAQPLLIERDASPRGTTAMSTGLIPAAGTPEQAAAGIRDTPERFAADILAKSGGCTDAAVVARLAAQSAATIAFLQARGVPLSLVDGFLYPGHSVRRMMGTPNRTGEELMAALLAAAEAAGAALLSRARVRALLADAAGRIEALEIERPDGARETIAAGAVVLACGGFAGSAARLARHIPAMAGATVHSHPGNRGDALDWAEALGAALADMDAWQGHGGLAAGHGVPILWPSMAEGGVQLNAAAQRFHDESLGYSEAAAQVHRQPGGQAWSLWDSRIEQVLAQFDDHRDAHRAGAIIVAADADALAAATGLPAAPLAATLAQLAAMARGAAPCPFGRDFTRTAPLAPPFYAARVVGALFHTQGGLVVDGDGRVLRAQDGRRLPNLFAAGGTARGVSGPGAAGYIAGNGLLTATTLGRLAGAAAARVAMGSMEEAAA